MTNWLDNLHSMRLQHGRRECTLLWAQIIKALEYSVDLARVDFDTEDPQYIKRTQEGIRKHIKITRTLVRELYELKKMEEG